VGLEAKEWTIFSVCSWVDEEADKLKRKKRVLSQSLSILKSISGISITVKLLKWTLIDKGFAQLVMVSEVPILQQSKLAQVARVEE